MKSEQKKKRLEYKWVIVGLCFLMVFTCLGFCSSNKGLYLSAMTEALGIKRSTFSVGDSFRYVTTSIVNLFFGSLVLKFGTKKLIGAGFLCLIASSLLYAVGTNVAAFYIAGSLLGLGLSWTTTTMVGCVVGRWCKENRGTIMGAVLCANGVGGALAAQIMSPIIYQEGNPFGYRTSYFLVAAILFAVGLLIVIFYRENPPGYVTEAGGSQKKKGRGQSWDGIEYKEAVRRPYFYLVAVCIFFTGLMLQGVTGVAAAHMKDVGLNDGYVATVLSVCSLTLAVSKFLAGFLYDRLGLRITVTICDVAAIVVMLILAVLTGSETGRILAMSYSFLAAIALPLETIMIPIFANDLFGDKPYEKILGLFVSINTAGYAVGSPVMNWTFDHFGTYRPIFFLCAALMAAVLVASQIVMNAAEREKRKVLDR